MINSTFVTLRLDAWHSGGCPISYFEVKHKHLSDAEWFLVSNNVLPETGKLLLSELLPGTWYNLMISAQNDAGSTDAEYVFATLTLFGGKCCFIIVYPKVFLKKLKKKKNIIS